MSDVVSDARGIVLGGLIAAAVTGCLVRQAKDRQLTGTCAGACAHYVACKPAHPAPDHARCELECPDVFGDSDSLMAFESLRCRDAVEYVDGAPPSTAATPGR